MKLSGALIFGLGVMLSPLVARANDGGIAWGGNPRLLQSHPSVTMQSEEINITVRNETVTADCRFVFRNDGKATKVRMGFPAEGAGDMTRMTSMGRKHSGAKPSLSAPFVHFARG
jgi:hypothetical protein